MRNKDPDLLVDVIHPFVRDLTDLLKKHAEKAAKLGENEKISYLRIIEELADILMDAYRRDVLQESMQYLNISSLMKLINIYLTAGSGKVNYE